MATSRTRIVDKHLGEITPAMAAKRRRQAARLRTHCEEFMADEMFKEAAEILEVSKNLDPSFEFLIAEAKAKQAHKEAVATGDVAAIVEAKRVAAAAEAARVAAETDHHKVLAAQGEEYCKVITYLLERHTKFSMHNIHITRVYRLQSSKSIASSILAICYPFVLAPHSLLLATSFTAPYLPHDCTN